MSKNTLSDTGERAHQHVENHADRLLTYKEAGALLKLGPVAVRHWANTGKLRVAKFNARVHRIFESDVQKLREAAIA